MTQKVFSERDAEEQYLEIILESHELIDKAAREYHRKRRETIKPHYRITFIDHTYWDPRNQNWGMLVKGVSKRC